MREILVKYLPDNAVTPCFELIKVNNIYLRIVNERKTRHGDYRQLPNGQHLITMNATANKYRFLITFIHEVAHLVAFERFGRLIKPHGNEWKYTFQQLMKPFIIPEIFPQQLGSTFRIKDGRVFRKGQRRVKCYDCVELGSGKKYIFQPHAEVELIKA